MLSYNWSKKDYPKSHGKTVFTTFACGGGSSMGYKMAGYDVIGANDIDPQMEKVYKHNHDPKLFYICPIGELVHMELDERLYNLDLFDGSPPCSTFSTAGSREKAWKKKKKFREGQAEQNLSDLFFDWIALLKKLQPKVAVAENVKGMLMGNAVSYTNLILKAIDEAGYDVQLFLLNGATMGLPQARERVFFVCRRKDLKLPPLNLEFNEKVTTYGNVKSQVKNPYGKPITNELYMKLWEHTRAGKNFALAHYEMEKENRKDNPNFQGSYFNSMKLSPNKPMPTITAARGGALYDYEKPCEVSDEIYTMAGSFPRDYQYLDIDPKYLVGMSVPPLMTYRVADEIYKQLLINL